MGLIFSVCYFSWPEFFSWWIPMKYRSEKQMGLSILSSSLTLICLWLKGIQDKNSVAYFWLTNLSLLFAADFQANPTDTSATKRNQKVVIQELCNTYPGCLLLTITNGSLLIHLIIAIVSGCLPSSIFIISL